MTVQVPDNFGGLPPENSAFDSARVAVLPIPYEGTTTYCKGTAKGPRAVIEASQNMELFDEELWCNTSAIGIFTCEPVKIHESERAVHAEIQRACSELIRKRKFVVGIGGEHSIAVGLVRAHAQEFGELTVLQLDAHSDLRDSYDGSRYSHACVMARALEVCPVTQVGIRSVSEEEVSKINTADVRTFFAHKLRTMPEWIERIVDTLNQNVYVTIDIDVFDPAYIPGTGTPEPGGLNWNQVTGLLRRVAEARRIVGFDVNEVMPLPDNRVTEFTSAKLIYRTLGYVFKMNQAQPHFRRTWPSQP
jgi:agmatinase